MSKKNLYFIQNVGCDDTTSGLVELDDTQKGWFFGVLGDLNKNSYYGCMPKVRVYQADWKDFVELPRPEIKRYPDICTSDFLHLGGKTFTYAPGKTQWDLSSDDKEIKL